MALISAAETTASSSAGWSLSSLSSLSSRSTGVPPAIIANSSCIMVRRWCGSEMLALLSSRHKPDSRSTSTLFCAAPHPPHAPQNAVELSDAKIPHAKIPSRALVSV
jgi:hypothetical protein